MDCLVDGEGGNCPARMQNQNMMTEEWGIQLHTLRLPTGGKASRFLSRGGNILGGGSAD